PLPNRPPLRGRGSAGPAANFPLPQGGGGLGTRSGPPAPEPLGSVPPTRPHSLVAPAVSGDQQTAPPPRRSHRSTHHRPRPWTNRGASARSPRQSRHQSTGQHYRRV